MKKDNFFKYMMMDIGMVFRTKTIDRKLTSWMMYIFFANWINAWKKRRAEKRLKQEWKLFLSKKNSS